MKTHNPLRRVSLTCALWLLAMGAAFVATASPALSQELVAVVHESNPASSLSTDDVKRFYLGQTTNWSSGGIVALVVQPPSSASSKALFKRLLKMAPSRFKHMWQEKALSGQGVAPKKVGGSASALISKVSEKPKALGVLLKSEVPAEASGVKFIPIQ
ncbi:MAG: hypothetical protein ACE366_22135 [Bradymonadia bacterium]